MEKLNCIKCGHSWLPRVEKPAECPKCKTYNHGGKNESPKKSPKRVK